MNLHHPCLIGSLLVGSACLLATAPARSASVSTNSPATAVVSNTIPVSVFEDTVTAGRDPFFPRSRRRTLEASAAVAGNAGDISSLVLQGISSTARNPLATSPSRAN